MASLEEIRQERIRKLLLLREKGINPYPAKTRRETTIAECLSQFDEWTVSEHAPWIAGRVMALRAHGGSIFFDIFDGTGKLQGYVKKEELGDSFETFESVVDVGDFIEISGTFFLTKKGERSVLVKDWGMLTKNLRPLPEKWHGLTDIEERFRKRYLDILMNPEMREIFEKKSLFWDTARRFMKDRGFMEVETPTLEVTTGGAEANPFKTYHQDFKLDVFLRISIGELWQKRLMAAGFPQTFEIGRAYRNEGSDMNHVQEFTNMEFYWAYANYRDGMNVVKDLYRTLALEVFGKTRFETRGHTFDLKDEWQEVDYQAEVLRVTGIDVLTSSDDAIRAKLTELGVSYEGDTRERLTDTLWKYCRKSISGPAFLINHPKLVSPLSKEQPANPLLTERFQVILAGSEVGNGFSELNDPLEQEERFKVQQALLDAGDGEAMMPDWEFTEMLEYGMPPTCGFGFGEMLFAFLAERPIREIQLFPLMKPKHADSGKAAKRGTQVAVAVVNRGLKLAPWEELNTVAHLSAAFGARTGTTLFSRSHVVTKDDKQVNLNIRHAIIVKQSDSVASLRDLVIAAKEEGLTVEEFTREMITTTSDAKVEQWVREKNLDEIEYLGVLIFGDKSDVDRLTETFGLYA